MTTMLVTGGARSGKSRHAQHLAGVLGGDDVEVVVTLEPGDEELARRIARHQTARPATWRTTEAPRETAAAVAASTARVVLLDCLSGLVSNVLLDAEPRGEQAVLDAVAAAVDELLDVCDAAPHVVVVTNEVGDGVVPAHALGRWYRDALGTANQRVAAAADVVVRMTVGIPQLLKGVAPQEQP